MTVNITNPGDGSMGLQGVDSDAGEFIAVGLMITPTSVSSSFFVAPRAMRLRSIRVRMDTAGTDAGAVTAVINKAATGTAIGAGTITHAGTINVKGAAAANQAITTLTTPAVDFAKGDAMAIVFTGVMTAAVGSVSVGFTPL